MIARLVAVPGASGLMKSFSKCAGQKHELGPRCAARSWVGRRDEPLVRIVDVEVVGVGRERIDTITAEEVRAEGFPDMTPEEFFEFF
ncbi:hypothetical protein ACQPZ2_03240 [Nocardia pseudovaccinii]|uniref:hypothetical protein n=1 Tax=Nocardia pseudovaccinii TaxID=189540 RepID=UPI003D8FD75B